MSGVPELPEVEITARRLDAALRGVVVESALAPGINALKTFDPPLHAIEGAADRPACGASASTSWSTSPATSPCSCTSCRPGACSSSTSARRCATAPRGCSSGSPTATSCACASSARASGRGSRCCAREDVAADDALATLGPEAWPDPPPLRELLAAQGARPLHGVLRDQHVIAGIGRSWVDEILWTAMLSPFKRADDLDDDEADALREACVERLDGAIEHYERVVTLPIPDKLPMPLEIHRRQGEACPRCGATIEAVHYEDYVMCYCPQDQTGGRVLKDRRLSRLLK